MHDGRLWPKTSLRLSAEQRALLHLVGAAPEEVTRADIDSRALAREARWHNVVPLVCRRPEQLASLMGASDDLTGAWGDEIRYAIDTLKRTVPVWKKEHFEDGEVWVGLQGG